MLAEPTAAVGIERAGPEFQPVNRFRHQQRRGEHGTAALQPSVNGGHTVVKLPKADQLVVSWPPVQRPAENPLKAVGELLWRGLAVGLENRQEDALGAGTFLGLHFCADGLHLRPGLDHLLRVTENDFRRGFIHRVNGAEVRHLLPGNQRERLDAPAEARVVIIGPEAPEPSHGGGRRMRRLAEQRLVRDDVPVVGPVGLIVEVMATRPERSGEPGEQFDFLLRRGLAFALGWHLIQLKFFADERPGLRLRVLELLERFQREVALFVRVVVATDAIALEQCHRRGDSRRGSGKNEQGQERSHGLALGRSTRRSPR